MDNRNTNKQITNKQQKQIIFMARFNKNKFWPYKDNL